MPIANYVSVSLARGIFGRTSAWSAILALIPVDNPARSLQRSSSMSELGQTPYSTMSTQCPVCPNADIGGRLMSIRSNDTPLSRRASRGDLPLKGR
jgi:hypothetical protein